MNYGLMGPVALTSYHTAKSWNVHSFLARQAQNGPAQSQQTAMKRMIDRSIISLANLQMGKREVWFELNAMRDIHESHRLEYALKRSYRRVFCLSAVGRTGAFRRSQNAMAPPTDW